MMLRSVGVGKSFFGCGTVTLPGLVGRDIGLAICKHFGLDKAHVEADFTIGTKRSALSSVTLTLLDCFAL